MVFYDRINGTHVDKSSLPRDLDLGRFVNEDNLDLTNNIFDEGSDYYIHQELLYKG